MILYYHLFSCILEVAHIHVIQPPQVTASLRKANVGIHSVTKANRIPFISVRPMKTLVPYEGLKKEIIYPVSLDEIKEEAQDDTYRLGTSSKSQLALADRNFECNTGHKIRASDMANITNVVPGRPNKVFQTGTFTLIFFP